MRAGSIINAPGSGNFLLTSGHCYTGEPITSPQLPCLLQSPASKARPCLQCPLGLHFECLPVVCWRIPASYLVIQAVRNPNPRGFVGRADKSAPQDFHFWLVIFNHEEP